MQMQPDRRLSVFTAAILSLLLPGLGHLYVGQPRRAGALFAALFVYYVLFVFCQFGWLPRFWMLAGVLLIGLGIYLFALVDTVVNARRGTFIQNSESRWYVHAGVLVASLIVYIATPGVVGAIATGPGYYEIPSASMAPTLRVGDTLLVDTRYYGSHQPARGDVAVFTYAKEPDVRVRHIQRIVAVAKDRVEVNGGRVVINGQAVNEPYIDAGDPEAFYNTTPVITVADGFVFVMGDSRANSADSRQTEKGPVPVRNLIGRATDLVTSDEISRMGKWIGTPAKP